MKKGVGRVARSCLEPRRVSPPLVLVLMLLTGALVWSLAAATSDARAGGVRDGTGPQVVALAFPLGQLVGRVQSLRERLEAWSVESGRDGAPGGGTPQESPEEAASRDALARELDDIAAELERLAQTQLELVGLVEDELTSQRDAIQIAETFRSDPPTIREVRDIAGIKAELAEIHLLLDSYASDRQRRNLPWPQWGHPSWDALDDIYAKVDWTLRMLQAIAASGRMTGESVSHLAPECPGLRESFPDTWGCGGSFAFQGEGGVIQVNLDDVDCGRTGKSGGRFFYSNAGPGFSGWGIQWDGSPDRHFNGFQYTSFTFWVRGVAGGETFQVGLKDTSGLEVKVESMSYVTVDQTWRQVTIPLEDFNGVNKGAIANWNLGFNQTHGTGVICIDDARFTS